MRSKSFDDDAWKVERSQLLQKIKDLENDLVKLTLAYDLLQSQKLDDLKDELNQDLLELANTL